MPIEKTCAICNKQFKVHPSSHKQKFCSAVCYGIWQQGRNRLKKERKCSIKGCNKKHSGHGYCREHYVRIILQRKKRIPFHERFYTCQYCGKQFQYGQNRKFCSWECCGMGHRKSFILKKGYKKILVPTHPRADTKGYVFEHIVVLESQGIFMSANQVCHHKDHNKLNNHLSNLVVCDNQSMHMKTYHSSS